MLHVSRVGHDLRARYRGYSAAIRPASRSLLLCAVSEPTGSAETVGSRRYPSGLPAGLRAGQLYVRIDREPHAIAGAPVWPRTAACQSIDMVGPNGLIRHSASDKRCGTPWSPFLARPSSTASKRAPQLRVAAPQFARAETETYYYKIKIEVGFAGVRPKR